MSANEEYAKMPMTARWIADFIQRVGFPIFIAIALLILYVWHISKVETETITSNQSLTTAIDKNTEAVTALRHFLTHKYD